MNDLLKLSSWQKYANEPCSKREHQRVYEHKGRYLSLTDISRLSPYDLSTACIKQRLSRGWSIDKTIATPKLSSNEDRLALIADAIDYPVAWDRKVYPTVYDAILHKLTC